MTDKQIFTDRRKKRIYDKKSVKEKATEGKIKKEVKSIKFVGKKGWTGKSNKRWKKEMTEPEAN